MELIINVDEKLVCEGFERPFTEEERNILIRAIGNGRPYNPSGDSISRKQVLDELMAHQYSQDFCKEHGIEYSINSSMVRIIVNGAQAVESERPQGEWETVRFTPDELNVPKKSKFDFVKCPFCGIIHQGRHNFCSYCGADMRGSSHG